MVLKYLCLDVETVPNQALPAECVPKFDESQVKTGNLKDPLKIREKIEEERARFDAEINKAMSTDPDLCQVVCVVAYESANLEQHVWYASSLDEETALLIDVWDRIRACYNDGVPLVTFNGMSFDVPVLLRRAMIEDIVVAPGMARQLLARQENNHHHYDLMQLLACRGPFGTRYRGLDYYLQRFGIGAKLTGWDGSRVYPAWIEGRHAEIIEYCGQDVRQTAKLYERVAPWLIAPRTTGELAKAKGQNPWRS